MNGSASTSNDDNDLQAMQLALYNPIVEPRFECLYIGNIPIRTNIRLVIFQALQRFTDEFGPIVRFRVPGPWHGPARRRNAPPGNVTTSLHSYVYFLEKKK